MQESIGSAPAKDFTSQAQRSRSPAEQAGGAPRFPLEVRALPAEAGTLRDERLELAGAGALSWPVRDVHHTTSGVNGPEQTGTAVTVASAPLAACCG